MKNYLEDPYTLPTYVDFFYDVPSAFNEAWQMVTWHDLTPSGWYATLHQGQYSSADIWFVIIGSVMWTALRTLCTRTVFQVRKLGFGSPSRDYQSLL